MVQNQFYEVQRIDTIWPIGIFALAIVSNWVLYFLLGHDELSFFYVSMGSIVLICSFLLMLRLYTKVNSGGIHYRFFPFHLSWKTIHWKDIKVAEMRKFRPLQEYGGYGLRYGKSGYAYILSGKVGLQLVYKDQKKLLIGTSTYHNMQENIELYFPSLLKMD